MKAFWNIKRNSLTGVLWLYMYTDEAFPYHAACRPIEKRGEAPEAFAEFVNELRRMK